MTTFPTRACVFMARHGETESNRILCYAGDSPEPLTARGRRQILDLARALAVHGLREVWASPVQRALESAEIVSRELGIPLQKDPRMAEMNMGPWTGLTEAEVERMYPREYEIWSTRPASLDMRGRETLGRLRSRVMAAVDEASRRAHPILLMTHVAPMRVATLSVLDLDLNHYKRLSIPNAACLVVDLAGGDVRRVRAGAAPVPPDPSIRSELARTEARSC